MALRNGSVRRLAVSETITSAENSMATEESKTESKTTVLTAEESKKEDVRTDDSLDFENDDTFAIDYLVYYNETGGTDDESV